MYAAVPRMMPICVIAGVVIVGDWDRSLARALAESGASALARPKSSTFTVPSGSQLDIRGLEIAVDDPLLVGRFERLRDLPRDRQRLVDGNRPVREAIGERRSLDQLQYERLQAI